MSSRRPSPSSGSTANTWSPTTGRLKAYLFTIVRNTALKQIARRTNVFSRLDAVKNTTEDPSTSPEEPLSLGKNHIAGIHRGDGKVRGERVKRQMRQTAGPRHMTGHLGLEICFGGRSDATDDSTQTDGPYRGQV